MKKFFFSVLFTFSIALLSPIYALDFATVLDWMHSNNLTKYSTVDTFRPDDAITRGEAAKFVNQYGQFMKLDKTYTACDFADIAWYDYTLIPHIGQACAYGLLKGSQGNFMPNNNMTEAQGITIAMRSLYGIQDETITPWYKTYYDLGAQAGITTDSPLDTLDGNILTRAQLGTWFYLAAYVGQDLENQITDGIKAETGEEITSTNITGYLNYSASKVAQALAQGQHVVLFFHADWCPTCKLLHDDLMTMKDSRPSTLAIFKVEYDTATELKTTYSIVKQHTLIKLDKQELETKRNTTATTFDQLWKELVEGIGI